MRFSIVPALRDTCGWASLSLAQRMLLHAARLHLRACDHEYIARHGSDKRWVDLARLALRGGVGGLVAQHAQVLGAPRDVQRLLATHELAVSVRNREILERTWALCAEARREGYILVPLKGSALNFAWPYTAWGLRDQVDIDLLTAYDQLDMMADRLRAAGFEPVGDRAEQLKFHHHLKFARRDEKSALSLELHWTAYTRVFSSHRAAASRVPYGLFARPPRRRVIDAHTLTCRCARTYCDQTLDFLAPADMLLALILHWAAHRYRAQFKWLVDIAEFIRAADADAIDWPHFWQRANALSARSLTIYTLSLVQTLLDVVLPKEAVEADNRPFHDLARTWLSPWCGAVGSWPQPSYTHRLAIDLMHHDNWKQSLRALADKGRELVYRQLQR